MNGWDVFTWFCAVSLAASAVVIFAFFAQDAGSILSREMHPDHHEDEEPSSEER